MLAICAHPDDIESWCGGTLALLVERGCTVELAVCTAGEKGSGDRVATVEQVAAMAVYLCSDAASQITGANLSIDGGWTAQ